MLGHRATYNISMGQISYAFVIAIQVGLIVLRNTKNTKEEKVDTVKGEGAIGKKREYLGMAMDTLWWKSMSFCILTDGMVRQHGSRK